jgi:glutathione synthase/RimK-type ligase-like ATP-grasp enzyme
MVDTSKTVFIYTMPDDWHAILAEAALKRRGHRVLRYFGTDFPERAEVEFSYEKTGDSLHLHTIDGSYALSDFDVVWNRRMLGPKVPSHVDPRDREYVSQQIRFADASLRSLLREAFWINPYDAARNADHKPKQLQLALRNGLRIPDTLISNRPEAIRAFIDRHPSVIHKPLIGAAWEENDKTLSTYTARVRSEDLPGDELLRAAPGIFQAQVKKQFEVRAQFFGASCFALKIDPSRIEYGEMDWRLHQHGDMTDGSVTLPDHVYQACLKQLRSLGLVAGAFDFIVTPDDEWIYLEVNEAGQFIFVEQWCEELTLFDAFCHFVESGDAAFEYHKPSDPQRLAELIEQTQPEAVGEQDRLRREPSPDTQAEAA